MTSSISILNRLPVDNRSSIPPHRPPRDWRVFLKRERVEQALVGVTLLAILLSLALEYFQAEKGLVLAVNVLSYVAGGYFGVQAGMASLRQKEINVDLLMVLAAGGAALVNQWHEGAILLFLFSLSNVLQAYAMDRSRQAIRKLLDLRPEEALVRRGEGLETVAIEALVPGDIVVLMPGERVPIDGKVVKGSGTVNQASITGESMPVLKEIGDDVFAGSLNENGALDIRVSHLASESTLARIIELVEAAQEHKAETQRFLDRFEQYYAIGVIGLTLLLVFIPPLLMGADFADNFYRAMVVMVVASPCALVISTPASILSAIANGARKGVLFKGGAHLENMAHIKVVALDKTGTLTCGEPDVTDIWPSEGVSAEFLLTVAAAMEARSEHPLAYAVMRAAQERHLTIEEANDFEAIAGHGVRGWYGGHEVLVGSSRLIQTHGLSLPLDMAERKNALEAEGKTVLVVYQLPHSLLGLIAVADRPRREAVELVKHLHKIGIDKVVMLTGDNQRAAAAVAKATGIDEFYAELLPQDKVEMLNHLQARYGNVAMVGDGVNDAPALASAAIGIAMGAAGTDVALETADVVLMSSELNKIPYAVALSRQAQRVVWQNIAFSLTVIVVLITAALLPFFELPLPLGVVGHEGSTLIVVMNGLRLLMYHPQF